VELVGDVGAADWIVAGVRDFRYDVGSLVPEGFGAYARVFHPALRHSAGGQDEVRWATVAEANGRVAHPGMEWISITGSWRFLHQDSQPGIWDEAPREGSLPARQAAELAILLAEHTTTPRQCWFAVWDGFGAIPPHLGRTDIPRIQLPHRSMLLLAGPLSEATTSFAPPPGDQRASLWWPEDRAWCVATDVDLMTTYVGGTQECINALVNGDDVEAMPVSVGQKVTWDSDRVNPAPPRS
jgi:hypothetical protein